MKLKKVIAIATMSILTLTAITGCKASEPSDNATGDTIKIGGSFALTGDVAIYGKAANNGTKLAIKEYNEKGGILDKQLEYFAEDNKGDEIEATTAFQKLVDKENVIAFMGSDISSTTEAIAKIAAEINMPMITPTGTKMTITAAGDNVFRACYIDPYQGRIIADFAATELQGKTAAILMNNGDDYSIGIAETFAETFESHGGTIVNKESYTDQDKDYKPLLLNIKGNNPDIILIADYYGPVALIAQQIKETGIEATLVGPDGWDGVVGQIEHDPSVLEGAFFINHYSPDTDNAVTKAFIESYKTEYGEDPNAFAALGYDAAKILLNSIIEAGSTDATAIIEKMQASHTDGATGTITFGPDRNPVKSVAIIQIKDGKNTMYKLMDPQ
ncbi:MAG TPA: ABC transporter substrate-binding protein [Epulopiscium sp.]|nr:ABC transporter substrate-binding protein [Candidatus Epulonipiscium sp.]